MSSVVNYLATIVVFAVAQQCSSALKDLNPDSEEDAGKYLDYLEQKVCFEGRYKQQSATFNYEINITDENFKIYNEELSKPALFDAEYISFNWECFKDPSLLRQAKFYTLLNKPLDPAIYKAYGDVIAALVAIGDEQSEYCLYNSSECGPEVYVNISSAPEITTDPKELQFYWEQNRVPAATLAKPLWKQYVDACNNVSKSRGFSNRADESMDVFEVPPFPQFKKAMLDLWEEFKPFYQQLHAYIRGRLRDRYGPNVISKKGPIPVHLYSLGLGSDIAAWMNYLAPYPEKNNISNTNEMIKQNYTAKKILNLTEDFYQSLGLETLPDSFYKYSMFEEPEDGRKFSCMPTSYDYYNRKDFRIQHCTYVSFTSFVILLHEFGHIHNFVAYKHQPCPFRDNTKIGIIEAIADTMVLSISSYKYLQRIGLASECEQDSEEEINNLYTTFRNTVGFGPITLIEDLWRWSLFAGEVKEEHYNQAFWDLRLKIQGVVPPKTNHNIEEFIDAANDFIMLDDTPAINYFICAIVEYQLYEGLCIIAGQYDPNDPNSEPLHNCDLYGNKEAGKKWHEVLQIGASKPYTAYLEIITGSPKLSASSLLKYYEPLYNFLIAENKKRGEFIGWE